MKLQGLRRLQQAFWASGVALLESSVNAPWAGPFYTEVAGQLQEGLSGPSCATFAVTDRVRHSPVSTRKWVCLLGAGARVAHSAGLCAHTCIADRVIVVGIIYIELTSTTSSSSSTSDRGAGARRHG